MRTVLRPTLVVLAILTSLGCTACASRPVSGPTGVPANPFASNYPSPPSPSAVSGERRRRASATEALRPPGDIAR